MKFDRLCLHLGHPAGGERLLSGQAATIWMAGIFSFMQSCGHFMFAKCRPVLAGEGVCLLRRGTCVGNQWLVSRVLEGVFRGDTAEVLLRCQACNEGELQAPYEVDQEVVKGMMVW